MRLEIRQFNYLRPDHNIHEPITVSMNRQQQQAKQTQGQNNIYQLMLFKLKRKCLKISVDLPIALATEGQ
jgi:hypothetical protein